VRGELASDPACRFGDPERIFWVVGIALIPVGCDMA